METNLLLTSEEIVKLKNFATLFADLMIEDLRKNSSNPDFFEEEKDLIASTMKKWWMERSWISLFRFLEIETDFLVRDKTLNSFMRELFEAQSNSISISNIYFELAKDQYHDGDDKFYEQMGVNRYDEVWKTFRDALAIEPNNVEILANFIQLMFQSNECSRCELFQAIQSLFIIERSNAKSFSRNINECYDYGAVIALLHQPRQTSILNPKLSEFFKDAMESDIEIPYKFKKELNILRENPSIYEAEEYVHKVLPSQINSSVINMYNKYHK